jgi:short-subunit dehydrogenase
VAATGGTLDCLFNCAGLLEMGPHYSIPPKRVDHMLAVNINGVVNCIDAALPALRATSGAHIVNMSSAAAEYGMPDLAAYSASKFFVRGFTEALNIELEPLGIQVSAVLAAYVRTPMVTEAKVKAKSLTEASIRVGPEQVAEAVWKAAHGSKVLWRVGSDAFALNAASRIFGTSVRRFYKRISGY